MGTRSAIATSLRAIPEAGDRADQHGVGPLLARGPADLKTDVATELLRKHALVEVLSALADAAIPTRGIQTAPLRWTALIDEASVDDAVRAVHAAME